MARVGPTQILTVFSFFFLGGGEGNPVVEMEKMLHFFEYVGFLRQVHEYIPAFEDFLAIQ